MSEPGSLDHNATRKAAWLTGLRSLALIIAVTLGLLAAGAGYARIRFGSISAGLEYLQGQSMLVDERDKTIGGVQAGSQIIANYILTNNSNRPVKLVGATYSCTCTQISEIPITLASSESKTVSVSIKISEHESNISGSMRLFTDEPNTPEIHLSYTVRALKMKGRLGP